MFLKNHIRMQRDEISLKKVFTLILDKAKWSKNELNYEIGNNFN